MKDVNTINTPPVSETWQEIEGLVDELTVLSKAETAPRHFHAELLDRALQASSAVAGAVWNCEADGMLVLSHQLHLLQAIDLQDEIIEERHRALIHSVAARGESLMVSPRSETGKADLENPTDFTVVAYPILVEQKIVGIVELLLEADNAPSVQRGTQQLLSVLSELASDFHRNWQLRQLKDREESRQSFDQYIRLVHQDLDLDHVTYTIANEGRRLIGCDRIAVLTCRGNRCTVKSMTGADTVDRRSTAVRSIELITSQVCRYGQAVWCDENQQGSDVNVQSAVERYRLENNTALVGVVPLNADLSSKEKNLPQETIGALVIENFGKDSAKELTKQRTLWVTQHSVLALHNAMCVSQLPLISVSRWLARLAAPLRMRRLPITLFVVAGILVTILAMMFIKTEFSIEARGELQPVEKEVIYAPADGTVVGFPAFTTERNLFERGSESFNVTQHDVVVELLNSELEYETTTVLGEIATADQKLKTIEILLEQHAGPTTAIEIAQSNEWVAKKLELRVLLESLDKRLEILRKENKELSIQAQIDGEVQTWDVVSQLKSRPVRQGQQLMTIVNVHGPWRLDVYIPDKHIGYVHAARDQIGDDLEVSFIRKSEPEITYRGQIERVSLSTENRQEYGSSVLVTVALDRGLRLNEPRPGTTVIAKIHCGKKPIGYVWLHDLFEMVRSQLFF